jgi:serine/threonine protein kinase
MDGENSAQISSSQVLSASFPEKINVQSFQPIQLLGKGSFGEVFLVQKKSGTN